MVSKDPRVLENEFYGTKLYHSYSSLNLLLHSPKAYYNRYIMGDKRDKMSSGMLEGKIVHCLLLDNDNFYNQFVISPLKLPGESSKKVVDMIFDKVRDNPPQGLSACEEDVLDVLRKIDLHQSLNTDKQRMEKICAEQNEN